MACANWPPRRACSLPEEPSLRLRSAQQQPEDVMATAEAPAAAARATLPAHGHSRAEVTHMLADIAEEDVHNWEAKLMAGGTYPAGDDVMEVAKEAYLRFFSGNPLYSSIFKSLAQMEREIVEMTAGLHHGSNATG